MNIGIIICTLITISFIKDILSNENNVGSKIIFTVRAFISAGTILFCLRYIGDTKLIHDISELTIIPAYLVKHLMLCSFLFIIIFYSIIMIKSIDIFQKIAVINDNVLEFFSSIENNTEISGKYKKRINLLKNLYCALVPIRKRKCNDSKVTIKSIIIISYFFSGLILLSPLTNYALSTASHIVPEYFSKDYDLYKSVFVISLIPYSINFFLKSKNK